MPLHRHSNNCPRTNLRPCLHSVLIALFTIVFLPHCQPHPCHLLFPLSHLHPIFIRVPFCHPCPQSLSSFLSNFCLFPFLVLIIVLFPYPCPCPSFRHFLIFSLILVLIIFPILDSYLSLDLSCLYPCPVPNPCPHSRSHCCPLSSPHPRFYSISHCPFPVVPIPVVIIVQVMMAKRAVLLLTSSARMGRKMVAVATLLVTSVNVAVSVLRIRTRIHFGNALKLMNSSPIISDNPDTC